MAKDNRFTTPVGTAGYASLDRPNTKFSELGDYLVTLYFEKSQKKALEPIIKAAKEALQKKIEANPKIKKRPDLPWGEEVDDQGNKTGRIFMKCKASNKENWDRKPLQFDAAGKRVNESIGSGTKMKVNIDIYTWAVASTGIGVTLQPVAVQIIDLVEYVSGGSADTYGFGEEEGFVSKEEFNGSEEGHKEEKDENEEDDAVHSTDEDEDLF